MNLIDLLVFAVLALAVWNGWRRGCVVQLCSLAGLFLAVWCGARFGTEAGRLCGFDEEIVAPAGFVLVLLATLCAVAVAGQLLRKVLRFAGLGVADILLGIAIAAVKYLLLLSLLFAAFDRMNNELQLVGPEPVRQSKLYRPMLELSDRIFPFVEQLREQAAEYKHAND